MTRNYSKKQSNPQTKHPIRNKLKLLINAQTHDSKYSSNISYATYPTWTTRLLLNFPSPQSLSPHIEPNIHGCVVDRYLYQKSSILLVIRFGMIMCGRMGWKGCTPPCLGNPGKWYRIGVCLTSWTSWIFETRPISRGYRIFPLDIMATK
jgi:hypothetical protein